MKVIKGTFHLKGKTGIASIASVAVNGKRRLAILVTYISVVEFAGNVASKGDMYGKRPKFCNDNQPLVERPLEN